MKATSVQRLGQLHPTELEVVKLVAKGLTNPKSANASSSDGARVPGYVSYPSLLLLFTATLAVQRPPEDHQRYRRDNAKPYGQRDQPKRTTNIHVTKALRTTAMAAIPACSRSDLCPSTDASSGPGPPVPGTVRLSRFCITACCHASGHPVSACYTTRRAADDRPQLLDAKVLVQQPLLGDDFLGDAHAHWCRSVSAQGTVHGHSRQPDTSNLVRLAAH